MTGASPENPFTVRVALCWPLCETANPGCTSTITDIKLATNNLSRMILPPGGTTTLAVETETDWRRSMPRHPWQDRVYTTESKGARTIGILQIPKRAASWEKALERKGYFNLNRPIAM